jgi:hypothetical protein
MWGGLDFYEVGHLFMTLLAAVVMAAEESTFVHSQLGHYWNQGQRGFRALHFEPRPGLRPSGIQLSDLASARLRQR